MSSISKQMTDYALSLNYPDDDESEAARLAYDVRCKILFFAHEVEKMEDFEREQGRAILQLARPILIANHS